MIREFKGFALRGNLLELAVAFVLGVAFAAAVEALVDAVIMQFIAAVVGRPDFSSLSVELNGTPIRYGVFLTALVNFLLIALVLFFIVRAANRALHPRGAPAEPPKRVSALTALRRSHWMRRAAAPAPAASSRHRGSRHAYRRPDGEERYPRPRPRGRGTINTPVRAIGWEPTHKYLEAGVAQSAERLIRKHSALNAVLTCTYPGRCRAKQEYLSAVVGPNKMP
jgi:large conductance mechanosensitive channel